MSSNPVRARLARLRLRLATNDVTTGESAAYPDLQPLDSELPPRPAYVAALAAARAMPGWSVVEESGAERRLRAEATTPVLRFVDDVWIEVRPGPDGGSRVVVRSASRIGRTDFGTNARRARSYLERLAASLPG